MIVSIFRTTNPTEQVFVVASNNNSSCSKSKMSPSPNPKSDFKLRVEWYEDGKYNITELADYKVNRLTNSMLKI